MVNEMTKPKLYNPKGRGPKKAESNYYHVTMICEDNSYPRVDASDVSALLKDFCHELFVLHNVKVKVSNKQAAKRIQKTPKRKTVQASRVTANAA